MKIGIIGAGWYGCHLAKTFQEIGHTVTLFEKNADIFQQISGNFGIRLHAGPHYPRSLSTRKSCKRGFDEFIQRYPELIVKHAYSVYGLGERDADGLPSKVSQDIFAAVCRESANSQFIDTKAWGYQNLISAANLNEPSIVVGERLRNTFKKYLSESHVKVLCNTEVKQIIQQQGGKVTLCYGGLNEEFDAVINASSYQALLPENQRFPLDMEVVYQPCLALMYKDLKPGADPLSFIVMDGWFPCLMPYVQHDEKEGAQDNLYILTHGKWTIMGSFETALKANRVLTTLSDDFIEQQIKPSCEKEMNRFWPQFAERFQYIGWKGNVLAKLKTTSEFRSAVTYAKNGVIHIIPGKVSNIFDVEREVIALLNKDNILTKDGYYYVQQGVLDTSMKEILNKPTGEDRSTCTLQTYTELQPSVPGTPQTFFGQSPPRPNAKININPVNTVVNTNFC